MAQQASLSSEGAVSRRRINMQMVQNVLLIWLDNNIDDNSVDCRNTITQLRRAVNAINTFTDGDQCVDFLTNIYSERACMIISGALCQNIVPLIHDVTQLHIVFIFCENKTGYEKWAKEWPKIKGVFTDTAPICEALKQAAQQCEQDAISISFMATDGDVSKKNLDQLDPLFMYTKIMKEILLVIKFEQQHFMEFVNHCREAFADNDRQLQNVKKFEQQYRDKSPIWWYTFECFLYSMLNRALQLMEVGIIIKIGFYIGDLHRHIEQLHKEQFAGQNSNNIFTVYRGQGLSKSDFEELTKTKGGLISFNNFLSTSKQRDVSLLFAESNSSNPDLVGILFVMTIDPSLSSTPFASIDSISHFLVEDEVLFAMHSVFRIGDITPMGEHHRLFRVELTLTSDNDPDLRVLTDRIREETFLDSEGWYRLGVVLLKMGQSEKAQHVYEILLEQETEESAKAPIYCNLGILKYNQGEYQEAIAFYEKSLKIYKKTRPPNDLGLANTIVCLGSVYGSMGDYSKALWSHEKALEIRQQSLPSIHPDLASSYDNIGLVYSSMGEYSKALSSHEKALEIFQKTLPPNHPDLGMSYNNIGLVYDNMGDYSKALSSHEKSLAIKQQSLPPNHPGLAKSYIAHGLVYNNMKEHSKAIVFCDKALAIQQQSLPPNHPDLAKSYIAHGLVYNKMKEHSKAIVFYDKALAIQQESLPPNHPDLAMSYNNIGLVYDNMGDYSKALYYYDKALAIKQQSLPPNHPSLASTYDNISVVYDSMGKYSKTLESKQQPLPPKHPSLAASYNNIGNVYDSIDKYSKALSSYEKALAIQQQSLPPDHPNLACSYNNIGNVYFMMGDFLKALSWYEKPLESKQQRLPPNHPDFASSYNNIGVVYENMGNYSKARSVYERAVEIGQDSLPSNHPNLETYRRNLENVKKNCDENFVFFLKEQ